MSSEDQNAGALYSNIDEAPSLEDVYMMYDLDDDTLSHVKQVMQGLDSVHYLLDKFGELGRADITDTEALFAEERQLAAKLSDVVTGLLTREPSYCLTSVRLIGCTTSAVRLLHQAERLDHLRRRVIFYFATLMSNHRRRNFNYVNHKEKS